MSRIPVPTASIVIAAHNYAQWLPAAVASALAQRGVDVRIIIVDDGSTDDTAAVARELISAKVSYIRQDNQGLASARNTGLNGVYTEFVCFLDADDLVPPDFLFRLHAALLEAPSNVGYAYPGARLFGSDDAEFPARAWSLDSLKVDNYVTATSLFSRSAVAFTRFDSSLRGWEDWDFALSLADRGVVGMAVPGCYFSYRKHSRQPSMFDILARQRASFARARRHIVIKHRRLFGWRERTAASIRLVRAVGVDAANCLKSVVLVIASWIAPAHWRPR